MCHAAAWLINGISDGHGPFWTKWYIILSIYYFYIYLTITLISSILGLVKL